MKIRLKISACIVVAISYVTLLFLQPFSVVCFSLGLPVCFWLSGVIHELGHLAAYQALGLQWKSLRISWFVFHAKEGFRFDSNSRLFSAVCTCSYHPSVSFWRYCIALLAGGTFTLLFGAASIFVSRIAASSVASFLQCFGLTAILSGLYNLLLPFSPDRALLRQIKKESA